MASALTPFTDTVLAADTNLAPYQHVVLSYRLFEKVNSLLAILSRRAGGRSTGHELSVMAAWWRRQQFDTIRQPRRHVRSAPAYCPPPMGCLLLASSVDTLREIGPSREYSRGFAFRDFGFDVFRIGAVSDCARFGPRVHAARRGAREFVRHRFWLSGALWNLSPARDAGASSSRTFSRRWTLVAFLSSARSRSTSR